VSDQNRDLLLQFTDHSFTDIALIKNNARVAAQIAVALSNFDRMKPTLHTPAPAFNLPAQRSHTNDGDMTVENVPVIEIYHIEFVVVQ
jgi:hypothetical protein